MARALTQRHRDTEVAKVPLWSVTYWDKHFTNVPKDCQPKVIKYHYYLAAELEPLVVTGGDVKILTTNITDLWTTTDKVQETLSEGEVVSIPWGGNPNIQYYNGKFVTSDNRIATSRDRSILDNRYLYFCMVGNRDVIASCYRGASLKHPEMAKVLNIEIPLPPLAEQKRIAGELDRICELKKNAEERLALMDQLVKSKFVEMFGDVRTNTNGWPIGRFDEVVKLQRGFDLPVQDRKQEGQIPIYGSNGLLGYHDEPKAFDGIVTGRSGTIGKVYCVKGAYWPLNTSLFSVDTHGNDIVYLTYLVRMFDLSRFCAGTGVPTLNRNDVHCQPLIQTPLSLQREFAAFVESVAKSKAALKETIATMETLYKERLQEHFA